MECKALFRLGVNICSHLISGAMLKSDFPLVDFVFDKETFHFDVFGMLQAAGLLVGFE
jgi:hypothetical protein